MHRQDEFEYSRRAIHLIVFFLMSDIPMVIHFEDYVENVPLTMTIINKKD